MLARHRSNGACVVFYTGKLGRHRATSSDWDSTWIRWNTGILRPSVGWVGGWVSEGGGGGGGGSPPVRPRRPRRPPQA